MTTNKSTDEITQHRMMTRARETFGLTPRESHVAALLAHGASAKEVATELAVTVSTARRHTESVLRKLGVNSRAKVASRLGLVRE
jgi:DNA-binding NarL/FixJ family response regulator